MALLTSNKQHTTIGPSARFRALLVSLALGFTVFLAGCDLEVPNLQPSEAQTPAAGNATPPLSVPAEQTTPVVGAADAPIGAQGGAPEAPIATPTPSAPPVEVTYTVKEGDTLSGIALQYDTTVEAIMGANELSSANYIFVGQELKIVTTNPNGAVAAQPADPADPAQPQPPAQSEQSEQPTQAPAPPAPAPPETKPTPVVVNGRTYDAYNQAAIKEGQWYQYTCEFDAAWIVLKSYGFDVGLEEQVEIVGLDTSIEPYYVDTPDGLVIYGGDVTTAYSGNYKKNFLARSSGQAMRKLFEHFGLGVTPVRDRASLEAALLRGELVWIKTTVDFKPWREATWIMPDGRSYMTVLGNDHALVVMGFNEDGVVIRDPLGPTSTNWQRKYEYMVPWEQFLAAWGAQEYDGLAVAPPNG
jgi:LysM repeat protein